tara:strand:- start:722 stop:1873 length:1152 start_codon:yes stop_codon:yes gene_type:complete
MSVPIYQRTATTGTGDIIPNAEYTVINEGTGTSQIIYSNRAGTTVKSPPYYADGTGLIQFYIAPGVTFRVAATDGVNTYTDRYVYAAYAQETSTDAGAGRLMKVGAFGLGAPALLITTDLNSLTVSGKYFIATTNANHPNTGKAGLLDVTSGISGTTRVLQKFVSYVDDAEFTRTFDGTSWQAWKQTDPQAFGLGVATMQYSGNVDANDFTVVGTYYGNFANSPGSGTASFLSVVGVDSVSDGGRAKQVLRIANSRNVYERSKYNGVWEDWVEIYTTANLNATTYGGDAGSIVAQGYMAGTTTAIFTIPAAAFGGTSVTIAGFWDVKNAGGVNIKSNASLVLIGSESYGKAIRFYVAGVPTQPAGSTVNLFCYNNSSIITVTL